MREPASPGLRSYAADLGRLLASEAELPADCRALAAGLAQDREGQGFVRAVDALRHALLAATGQAPADWDLLDPRTGRPDAAGRRVHPGMRAYLEDLRSPFNVGAAFRTADAFGLEELILSPSAADPAHPRAQRSAMGSVELVPWRRAGLECLGGKSRRIGGRGVGLRSDIGGFPSGPRLRPRARGHSDRRIRVPGTGDRRSWLRGARRVAGSPRPLQPWLGLDPDGGRQGLAERRSSLRYPPLRLVGSARKGIIYPCRALWHPSFRLTEARFAHILRSLT